MWTKALIHVNYFLMQFLARHGPYQAYLRLPYLAKLKQSSITTANGTDMVKHTFFGYLPLNLERQQAIRTINHVMPTTIGASML